ncbi:MAG: adenylate/guanylate cyclase domain-containing protein [Phycisphaeraceae bacterium]
MSRPESAKASTRNVTVMFTDIKGFTARVSDGSRTDLANLRSAHDKLLVPVFKHFNGTIVKTIGDAFLVRFDSPTDAVLCGVTLQEVLRQHNAFVKEEKDRFDVRVSINTGDVDLSEKDVLGEPVNIASRLQSIAETGEVFFTEAVYLSMNRKEAPAASVGEHTFKGIPYPVRVYKVESGPDSALSKKLHEGVRLTAQGPVIRGIEPMSPRPRRLRWFTIGAITASVLIIVAFFTLRPDAVERARRAAEASLKQGDAAGALATVVPLLSEHPDNVRLSSLAAESAEAHLDKLRAIGYDVALQWLRDQMKQYPHLELLRKHEGVLEAQALATTFVDTNNDAWAPLLDLCNRYANNPAVPYEAAQVLRGRVFSYAPLKLYQLALNRGYAGGREGMVEYCLSLFERQQPGHILVAHDIMKAYFPDLRVSWAKKQMAESSSGLVLANAMRVMVDINDPVMEAPLSVAIGELLIGYDDEAAADAALKYFEESLEPAQRQRVVDLHRWVVRPPVPWAWKNKPMIERNLKALETNWGLKAKEPASIPK